MTSPVVTAGATVEVVQCLELPGGPISYVLRRSPRARRLRVTIDPRRGVVVTVPSAGRRGWARPERVVDAFLREREAWIRRHLARLADQRSRVTGTIVEGAVVRFRGELHRVRIVPVRGVARTTIARNGAGEAEPAAEPPELLVAMARADRRPIDAVVRGWLVDRAREAIDAGIAVHAPALGVTPSSVALRDPRSRWGSATREGRLMFSWRLVLAPPEALETVVVHELAHLRELGHGPRFWALVASRRPDHRVWRRWLREHSVELHALLPAPGGGRGAFPGSFEPG